MAVDLSDVALDWLKRQINAPGADSFPDASNSELVGYLSDAFWEGKLDGFYSGYTETDGIINPESGDTDLSRDWISLIVIYAAYTILTNAIQNTNTLFRSKAGPVEFETQSSASMLRERLMALERRRDRLIDELSEKYQIDVAWIDNINARTNSLCYGDVKFDSGISW